MQMSEVVDRTLDAISPRLCLTSPMSNLEDVLDTDQMARQTAWSEIERMERA
jgi:hypothetical protein